jgi:FHA domain
MLPGHGRLLHYAKARDVHGPVAFVSLLPGPFVLIRLDERGGADEPVPWAIPRGNTRGVLSGDKVFVDIMPIGPDDKTASSPPQSSLPLPPAREQASAWVMAIHDRGLLGRSANSTLHIDERSISREHVRYRCHDDSLVLTPLQSLWCNGIPIEQPTAVRAGDILRMRDVELLVLSAQRFCDDLPRLLGEKA